MSVAAPPPRLTLSTGMRASGSVFFVRLAFFMLLFLLWEGVTVTGVVKPWMLPPPVGFANNDPTWYSEQSVLAALIRLTTNGAMFSSFLASMGRMGIGYGISVVFGLILGVMFARIWLVKQTLGSLAMALQSLPSICWLPFALLWVGLNEQAIIAVIILGALFSIALSTESAFRNLPPIYAKVGLTLGARNVTLSKDILFFAALPELLTGLKVGWTFAWRSLMAAELIRSDVVGMGSLLHVGRELNDVSQMLVAVLGILAIGLIIDTLVFGRLEQTVRRRYGLER